VLAALPKLKNLDGERNPHSSTCFSALVEHATVVQTEMAQFEPDFSFTEPDPRVDASLLIVPEVPAISHYEAVTALHQKLEHRTEYLVHEIDELSSRICAKV
jgi:hypothetical protein